jgi:ABC-2 type transport system permease protein
MNIYKHELTMNWKSVLSWSIAVVAITFLYMSLFTSMTGDVEMLYEMLDQFPEELLIAFGMNNIDFSTVLGYFSVSFLLCQVCLAIQASNYGFALVSIEERELTADFLLAKPVGRTHILTSKLLAAVTSLAVTNLVVWISSIGFVDLYSEGKPYDRNALLLLLASVIVFQLFFLTVGMLISLLVKRVRSVTPFSMALAFGMYVLSAFGGMLGEETLDLVTPFKHFEASYILKNAEYDLPLVMISVAAILISIVGSYVLYNRRNIPSAV